jgi:hypothetical protein
LSKVATAADLVATGPFRPIAVEWAGHAVITLHPIEGLEFVEETVAALGAETELAGHLFRECWVVGTGSEELSRAFGWNDRETRLPVQVGPIRPIRDQAAAGDEVAIEVDRGQLVRLV